jgi:hypothetical protein
MIQLLGPPHQISDLAMQMLCLITAWAIIICFGWSIFLATKNGIYNVKRLHRIPCSECRFFTGVYQLKCPVHPKIALTEEAINCSDYDYIGNKIH